MSDRELVRLVESQWQRLDLLNEARNDGIRRIAELLQQLIDEQAQQAKDLTKWIGTLNETTRTGFALVAEAIAKTQIPLPPPQPQMKGTIVADYQIPDDQPDGRVTYHLKATDSEGHVITDPAEMAKIGFTVQSSNEDAFVVTLDAEQPDPFNRVGGYHSGAPGQAALTSNMTNAAGELIGTGTDGFTVTTGNVTLGSVESSFDGLNPIGG